MGSDPFQQISDDLSALLEQVKAKASELSQAIAEKVAAYKSGEGAPASPVPEAAPAGDVTPSPVESPTVGAVEASAAAQPAGTPGVNILQQDFVPGGAAGTSGGEGTIVITSDTMTGDTSTNGTEEPPDTAGL